jgi:peptide/nickel transport system permease protein
MRYFKNFLVIIFGFILISNIRVLLYGGASMQDYNTGLGFYPVEYFTSIISIFKDFANLGDLEFFVLGKFYLLKDFLLERFSYSMTVLLSSLVIAIIVTYCFVVIFASLPQKINKLFSAIIDFLESLPDVFIIISLQLVVIIVYRETGNLIAEIAVYHHNIFKLPIICLTVVPTVLLIKTTLLLLKEEEHKLYIDLAKAKGLTSIQVLLKHTLRNVFYSLFYHSKIIFAFMLSNLLIIEQMFNMHGLTDLLLWSTGLSFVITAISIFLPFYLFFTIGEVLIVKQFGGKDENIVHI